jgi:Trp operon repressor
MKKVEKLIQLTAGPKAAPKDLKLFLETFFTEKELEMLAERLQIFEELSRGATQREVAARLQCSVVTVTRGAKVYRKHQAVIDRWLSAMRAVR